MGEDESLLRGDFPIAPLGSKIALLLVLLVLAPLKAETPSSDSYSQRLTRLRSPCGQIVIREGVDTSDERLQTDTWVIAGKTLTLAQLRRYLQIGNFSDEQAERLIRALDVRSESPTPPGFESRFVVDWENEFVPLVVALGNTLMSAEQEAHIIQPLANYLSKSHEFPRNGLAPARTTQQFQRDRWKWEQTLVRILNRNATLKMLYDVLEGVSPEATP